MDHYVLVGKAVAREQNFTQWAKWLKTADRKVDRTQVGECEVSTVFLGLDHNWGGGAPLLFETMVFGAPLLFETMVFGGEYDQEQWRYSTWEEAEEGHKRVVAMIEGE
jgi:hypothetical protein